MLLGKLVSETGGTLSRGEDLAGNLARAGTEIDGGYTLTYQPAHGDDGRYHPVQVSVVRREADARSRGGYLSPLSAEARRAMREAAGGGPVAADAPPAPQPARRRLVRRDERDRDAGAGRRHLGARPQLRRAPADRTPRASTLKATTQGRQGPLRGHAVADARRRRRGRDAADRAEFDAPAGRVQLDMTILGIAGREAGLRRARSRGPGDEGRRRRCCCRRS